MVRGLQTADLRSCGHVCVSRSCVVCDGVSGLSRQGQRAGVRRRALRRFQPNGYKEFLCQVDIRLMEGHTRRKGFTSKHSSI